jgi:hypothetical protein
MDKCRWAGRDGGALNPIDPTLANMIPEEFISLRQRILITRPLFVGLLGLLFGEPTFVVRLRPIAALTVCLQTSTSNISQVSDAFLCLVGEHLCSFNLSVFTPLLNVYLFLNNLQHNSILRSEQRDHASSSTVTSFSPAGFRV